MYYPKAKRKLIVLAVASACAAAPAFAQQQEASSSTTVEPVQTVVVTGLRNSLGSSMNLKRKSDGIVDGIVAADIGKFPDTNLAESLQRISGGSIDRSIGEGSKVTVRGVGPDFNLVLLNGRQMATSSLGDLNGRAFDFANLASEAVSQPQTAWTCEAVTESAGEGVAGVAQLAGQHAEAGQLASLRLGSANFCGVPARCVPGLQVHLRDDFGWLASFILQEDLRPQAGAVVRALSDLGIAVYVLSGDGAASVARVAAQAGISQAHGSCTPRDKLDFMRKLQAQGHQVAMVGDGLNDGPVLAGANASFAFGQAAPLAQAKADFVILGDQLEAVVHTLRLARRTLSVVRQNLWWALLYNAACVPLAVVGLLPAWLAGLGMAGSSLLVVLNAMRLARQVPLSPLVEKAA